MVDIAKLPVRILLTQPGPVDAVIYAMPVARAVAESIGHPVVLKIPTYCAGVGPLVASQPYIADCLINSMWDPLASEIAPLLDETVAFYHFICHLGRAKQGQHPSVYFYHRLKLSWDIAGQTGELPELHPLRLTKWVDPLGNALLDAIADALRGSRE